MAVSSATSSASPLSQLQLLQAQRAADRAEQNARALRERATEAQNTADREQENARNLQVQAGQAQQVAGSAKQGVIALKSLRQVQEGFSEIRQQIAQVTQKQTTGSTSNTSAPAPSINSQGQTTGTVVNVTA